MFRISRAPDERLNKWRGRMPSNGRLRVGICWAGSASHLTTAIARLRSNGSQRCCPFQASISSACKKRPANAERASWYTWRRSTRPGIHGPCRYRGRACDARLLISVDTSVAHLAGAMGKAVALLLPFAPDFRWLLDRTDSPWYPTSGSTDNPPLAIGRPRFSACGRSWRQSPAGRATPKSAQHGK